MKKSANLEVLYVELPWAERFAAARKDGFHYVEFWGWEDKDLDEVKRLLKENDLTLTGMGGDGPYSMCDLPRLPQTRCSCGEAGRLPCPDHPLGCTAGLPAVCKTAVRRIFL